MDLKDRGLAIYRHTRPIENNEQSGLGDATNKTRQILVFVLQNTKNSDIVTEKILPQVEKERIICPRCRHIFKLLKKIPIIGKNEVIGICDHCRKMQLEEPCRKCENAVKKFISSTTEQMFDTKTLIRTWLSIMKNLQQSYNNTSKSKTSESLSNIEKLCCKSIKSIREPIIKKMFPSDSLENDPDFVEYLQDQLNLENFVTHNKFNETIKYYITNGELRSSPSPSLVKTEFMLHDTTDTSVTHLKKFKDDTNKRNTQNITHESFRYFFPTSMFDENITSMISSEGVLKVPKLETGSETFIIKANRKMPKYDKKPAIEKKQIKKENAENIIKTKNKQAKQENVENIKQTKQIKPESVKDIMKSKQIKQKNVANIKQTEQIKPESVDIMKTKQIKQENVENIKQTKQIKPESGKDVTKTKQIKQENVENNSKTMKSGIIRAKKNKSEKFVDSKETLKMSAYIKPNLTGKSSIKSDKTIKAPHARNKNEDEFGDLKKLQGRYAKQKEEKQSKEKLYNKAQQILLEAARKAEWVTDDALFRESLSLTEASIKVTSDKVSRKTFEAHKSHSMKVSSCDLCNDSMLELEVGSIEFHKNKTVSAEEIIIGEQLFQCTSRGIEHKEEEKGPKPLIFQQNTAISDTKEITQHLSLEQLQIKTEPEVTNITSKGAFKYVLSDRTYIDKGWTKLPIEKIMRRMFVYRMWPAQPEYNWFQNIRRGSPKLYDTGDKLVDFDINGHGRWYYRNGRVALHYYAAEEIHAQQRYVIYSNGEPGEHGRNYHVTVLGTFDYLGNGIIFDHTGKIRLEYNQSEGVVLDSTLGPASHWKWHSLNDPPVLQKVFIDEQLPSKDPTIIELGGKLEHIKESPITRDEKMVSIELDNFMKARNMKLNQEFKPFQIKMKAVKINENFALKILDQTRIYLIFRDRSTQLKLNIGMMIDPHEIVGTENVELRDLTKTLKMLPDHSESLCALQDNINHTRKCEKLRMERENRIRRPMTTLDGNYLDGVKSTRFNYKF